MWDIDYYLDTWNLVIGYFILPPWLFIQNIYKFLIGLSIKKHLSFGRQMSMVNG